MRLFSLAVCSVLAALAAAPARADGEVGKLITAADKTRLANYAVTRKDALSEARAGDAAEVKALDRLLAKPTLSFAGFDMVGAWRCRVTKVGGISPLVVYGWFRCRVSDDGSGWRLEKLSGSQRTTGRFFDDGEKRLIYLGSQYVAGVAQPRYGAGPASDQVGYAFRTGPSEWRIELPAPFYESKLDIVEFRR